MNETNETWIEYFEGVDIDFPSLIVFVIILGELYPKHDFSAGHYFHTFLLFFMLSVKTLYGDVSETGEFGTTQFGVVSFIIHAVSDC